MEDLNLVKTHESWRNFRFRTALAQCPSKNAITLQQGPKFENYNDYKCELG
jgi:hypothetical protein